MNHPKIDIYVSGVYVCSTTWRKNIQEAKEHFIQNPRYMGKDGITEVKDLDASRVVCKYANKKE